MLNGLVPTVVLCLGVVASVAAGPQSLAKPTGPQRPAAPQISRQQLAADIQELDEAIAEATKESALYAGGLVKNLIDLRLATLKQSRAMLGQRATAQDANVSLRYTVDGRVFSPPSNAKDELAELERDVASLRDRIADQQAEADRYSGGLVQAMALSTVATSRQTLAMLEQKQMALRHGLPQFVGFASQSAPTQPTPMPPTSPAAAPATARNWEIVEVDSKITETNSTWSRFAWKLTMKNTGTAPLMLDATIEFQDKDGFVVDSDSSNRFGLAPGATDTITGYALINAEIVGNVARTVAKVRQISR